MVRERGAFSPASPAWRCRHHSRGPATPRSKSPVRCRWFRDDKVTVLWPQSTHELRDASHLPPCPSCNPPWEASSDDSVIAVFSAADPLRSSEPLSFNIQVQGRRLAALHRSKHPLRQKLLWGPRAHTSAEWRSRPMENQTNSQNSNEAETRNQCTAEETHAFLADQGADQAGCRPQIATYLPTYLPTDLPSVPTIAREGPFCATPHVGHVVYSRPVGGERSLVAQDAYQWLLTCNGPAPRSKWWCASSARLRRLRSRRRRYRSSVGAVSKRSSASPPLPSPFFFFLPSLGSIPLTGHGVLGGRGARARARSDSGCKRSGSFLFLARGAKLGTGGNAHCAFLGGSGSQTLFRCSPPPPEGPVPWRVLYCTALCCTVLCCAVLCCTWLALSGIAGYNTLVWNYPALAWARRVHARQLPSVGGT